MADLLKHDVFETAARVRRLYGNKAGQYAMEKYLMMVHAGIPDEDKFWYAVGEAIKQLEDQLDSGSSPE